MGPAPSVLVLTASVGEGHDRAAEAVTAALRRARPDCRVHVAAVVAEAERPG